MHSMTRVEGYDVTSIILHPVVGDTAMDRQYISIIGLCESSGAGLLNTDALHVTAWLAIQLAKRTAGH